MRDGDEIFISDKHTKENFNNLNLSIESDECDWKFAIKIFEDRIRCRYLNVIEKIIECNNLRVDGFSVMALNCLLIETLLQFKNGWNKTPKRRNKNEYVKFLREEFGDVFTNRKLAEKFYVDIRCGILHSAQTKNVSELTVNEEYIAKLINNNKGISVDVVGISKVIKNYFKNYVEKLKDNNEKVRINFLKKMKYL